MKNLIGLDVSHWQNQIDWNRVDTDFVILKASQGIRYVDNRFLANKQGARKNNILVGYYHFADGGDAIAEAKHFLKTVGDIKPGEFLVLDWEISHRDPAGWSNKFLDYIRDKTGTNPWWYSNDARAKVYGSKIAYPQWIARYKDYTGKLDWDFAPKARWDVWQFTSRGTVPGIIGSVDMNVTTESFINSLINKPMDKTYYVKSNLRNELKVIWDDFDHEKKDDHVEMARLLAKLTDDYAEFVKNVPKLQDALMDARDTIELQAETIAELESQPINIENMTIGQLIKQIVKIITGQAK